MKRFYCTECKKVKRVRRLDPSVDMTKKDPKTRVGQCFKHWRVK